MVEMRVQGLTIDAPTKTPVVVLREADGDLLLPVWVGAMEAMSISLALRSEKLPRPLTHDVLLLCLRAVRSQLRRVAIVDFRDGVFYAVLDLSGPEGHARVDCRPSDAIALAVRSGVPIMVEEHVLRQAETAGMDDDSLEPQAQPPVADAATDMVRRAGARRQADALDGAALRPGGLPPATSRDEVRYHEMLRSLEPAVRRKM